MAKEFRAYLVMPENAHCIKIMATSAEMAYRAHGCWFSRTHKIAVVDCASGETTVYAGREADGTPIICE